MRKWILKLFGYNNKSKPISETQIQHRPKIKLRYLEFNKDRAGFCYAQSCPRKATDVLVDGHMGYAFCRSHVIISSGDRRNIGLPVVPIEEVETEI